MKTIQNLIASISADIPGPGDDRYKPRTQFGRTLIELADGYHAYYQLPDGKTTGHLFIPKADIIALLENLDPNFKVPVKNVENKSLL